MSTPQDRTASGPRRFLTGAAAPEHRASPPIRASTACCSLSTAAQVGGRAARDVPHPDGRPARAPDPARAAQAARLVNLDRGGNAVSITVYVRTSAFAEDHQSSSTTFASTSSRASPSCARTRVLVGGLSAGVEDYADALYGRFPLLVAIVLAVTFVILMVLFRSIVLPLKAICSTWSPSWRPTASWS